MAGKGLKYVGTNPIVGMALGSQVGRKLYLGNAVIWAKGYNVSYSLINVTTDGSAFVEDGDSFAATLTSDTGYYLIPSTIAVMMGNTDITSTAYDSTDNTITIAAVTGDISITAEATEIIEFDDDAVKALCVANWGGNYVDNEITAKEAALVTSLGGVFYNNKNITAFNELRYFTGLTALNYTGSGTSTMGQFGGCTKLEEVIVPDAPFTTMAGAFRNTIISVLDFSLMSESRSKVNATYMAYNTKGIIKLKFSTFKLGNMQRAFMGCSNLEEIEISETLYFTETSDTRTSQMFGGCTSLETITGNGSISGLATTLDLSDTILNVTSAIKVLNGVSNVNGKTLTFNTSKQAEYTSSADFLSAKSAAEAKGWTVNFG